MRRNVRLNGVILSRAEFLEMYGCDSDMRPEAVFSRI